MLRSIHSPVTRSITFLSVVASLVSFVVLVVFGLLP